jgi:hypothetical protein
VIVAWDSARMASPKSPDQLAQAIEALVASFVDESRRAAEEAVQRSFAGARRNAKRAHRSRMEAAHPPKRRTADELSELCEKLYELVRARPGESMAVFAEEIGLPTPALHRPMSKLKSEGRVRSVGERNMTRYFPAVGRRSKGS